MNLRLATGAVLAGALLIALLWPVSCITTLIGVPPGARDPNITFCDTAFVRQVGTIRGYEGGHDVLVADLRQSAIIAAAAFFIVLMTAALVVDKDSVTWAQLLLVTIITVAAVSLSIVARDNYWFQGDPNATASE